MDSRQSKQRQNGIQMSEILRLIRAGERMGDILMRYPDLSESDLQAVIFLSGRGGDRHDREDTNPIRGRLISETLTFVRRLIGLENEPPMNGLIRISLIGSLATSKPDPKDIDLLLTVSDDMALAPLASRTRRLRTNVESIDRSVDIFLCNPGGEYIGRVCKRRDCRPGGRLRCHALHCGRRPFLHDDLQLISLPHSLIALPPVDLWPRLTVRADIPVDLEIGLIEPLGKRGSPLP